MKIFNLLTAISAISFSQFGEAADNFPHTGTSLVGKNPYPPVRKGIARSLNGNAQSRDDISLANKDEDIPGCAHMDVSAVLFFVIDFDIICLFVMTYSWLYCSLCFPFVRCH